jgi:two-component system, NtrC family, sensor kinase
MDVTVSQYRFRYQSLAYKMFLATFTVAVIPLLILGAVARHYFISSYKVEVLQRLNAVVQKGQARLEGLIEARIDALRVLSSNVPSTQIGAKSTFAGNLSGLQPVFGDTLQSIALLDAGGRQIAWAGSAGTPAPDSAHSTLPLKSGEARPYVTDVAQDGQKGKSFLIAVPVERDRDRWTILAAMHPDALTRVLADLDLGGSARIFIVSRQGEVQSVFPSGTTLPRGVWTESRGLRRDSSAPDAIEDSDGSNVSVRTGIKHTEWTLLLVEDQNQAYSAIYGARRSSIAAVLVGAIGLALVAVVVSRRLAHHVAQIDQEKQLINEQLMKTAKLASLGEMAAGIAHEINNPLAVIVHEAGWMQDLLADGEEEIRENIPEFQAALDRIQVHGKRCGNITHRLLSFARPIDRRAESVKLNALVQNVVELYSHGAQVGDVTLRVKLAADLPEVDVSPSEVEQVLVNLINNSLDAIGRAAGTIVITTRLQGHYVVVDLSDSGPGIAKEHLTRIFDPFFTTKPVGKGTGLGLAICYGIMKKMRGDVTVMSEMGKGTTFHLFFPLGEHGDSNAE